MVTVRPAGGRGEPNAGLVGFNVEAVDLVQLFQSIIEDAHPDFESSIQIGSPTLKRIARLAISTPTDRIEFVVLTESRRPRQGRIIGQGARAGSLVPETLIGKSVVGPETLAAEMPPLPPIVRPRVPQSIGRRVELGPVSIGQIGHGRAAPQAISGDGRPILDLGGDILGRVTSTNRHLGEVAQPYLLPFPHSSLPITMNSLLFPLLFLAFLCFFSSPSSCRHLDYQPDDLSSEERLLNLFEHWISHHSKNYTSPDGSSQKHSRFQIFKNNLFYIHTHNHNAKLKRSSHRLGLTRFADLTVDEFKAKHLGFRPPVGPRALRQYAASCNAAERPLSVDWRKNGAVTPVKDQGQCGSCWAFSSIGAIEGAHAVATGELVSLSEQELVSCVHSNYGCNGGLMDPSFEWVIKNGGINTEAGYPYVSGTGRAKFCKWIKKMRKSVKIDSYEDVEPNNEDALECAVAKQPVSVAINAGTRDFQLYAGGVFNSCSDDPNDIDHAVLAVGYGSEDGKDYWIVKNSWSEEWGLDGYVHIERSSGNVRGVCGIHSFPSYPVAKATSHSSVI